MREVRQARRRGRRLVMTPTQLDAILSAVERYHATCQYSLATKERLLEEVRGIVGQHECDEVCEATAMGAGVFRTEPYKGTPIHMLVCHEHDRCLVSEDSGGHFANVWSGMALRIGPKSEKATLLESQVVDGVRALRVAQDVMPNRVTMSQDNHDALGRPDRIYVEGCQLEVRVGPVHCLIDNSSADGHAVTGVCIPGDVTGVAI